jgi:hypothetical protein
MYNCEFCESSFTLKNNLNNHKKTAKYCLQKQFIEANFSCSGCKKILCSKKRLETHITKCIEYLLNIQKEKYELELKHQDMRFQQILIEKEKYELELKHQDMRFQQILSEKEKLEKDKLIITEIEKFIKELEFKLNEKDKRIKELEDKMHSLLVKAVLRPTVTNTDNRIQQTINNLIPLTDDHLKEQAEFLTLDHIKQGALGYANFACDYALKDRITCVDIARRKIKYKNSDGQIVTDPEMNLLSRKLFTSIKDKNTKLTNQYKGELRDMILKKYMESGNDISDEETKELESTIDQMNKDIQEASNLYYQTIEITDGKKPDIYHDFIREVCNKTSNK